MTFSTKRTREGPFSRSGLDEPDFVLVDFAQAFGMFDSVGHARTKAGREGTGCGRARSGRQALAAASGTSWSRDDVVGRAMLLAAIGLMAMGVPAVGTGDATSLTGSARHWSYR